MENNYFATLNNINVNDKTEKKNGLTYLSWAWAWAEIKKLYPDAAYTIYENANGWNYHTDGRTCWVKTGVTVCGIEHIEYLPVMDFRNNSIPADKVTSFDVNKAIQRSLTKACARHGLGLYVYAGEDLPEDEKQQEPPKNDPKPEKKKAIKTEPEQKPEEKPEEKQERAYITPVMLKALQSRCLNDKVSMPALCELYKVENLGMLTMKQYQNMNEFWEQVKEKIGGKA